MASGYADVNGMGCMGCDESARQTGVPNASKKHFEWLFKSSQCKDAGWAPVRQKGGACPGRPARLRTSSGRPVRTTIAAAVADVLPPSPARLPARAEPASRERSQV
eukprot:6190840-Pleurochrysis_carterae.AAC.2